MTKTTNAVDFLAALTCEPEFFETNNVTVQLRSLTFTEVQRIATKHKDDSAEMSFQALALGLVEPKLDTEQLEQLRNSKPGPLMNIAKRVMQISGMAAEDKGPLDGDGSSEL
jgi:hypothetical protein